MTKKELSQLYYLNREIEQEKRRLRELEEASTSVTPRITGLPHLGSISDKTALAAEIADCRAVIKAKLDLAIIEYNRLNRYIAGVEDSLVRQIMQLRYVNGLSWVQVAGQVGGGNTSDNVRMLHNRFMQK